MIRVAVIGCGKIAQVRHLPEYATNPNAQLVAYYDKNSQRAHEVAAQYGGKVYDSYFDLLKDPEIDAVSVCVENRSHAEMTTAALYAGKHVLCEKPMAVTLAECESMVAAAEFNNRHLMIGHNMRFDPVHRRAKELLEQGVIGDVITFRTGLGTSGPEGWSMEGNWFFDKKKAVMGALSDLGIHKIDLMQYLTGQTVIETTAKILTLNKHDREDHLIGVDDNALCILRMNGGSAGTMAASWTVYGQESNSTCLFGTRGVMRIYNSLTAPIEVRDLNNTITAYQFEHQTRSGVIDEFIDALEHDREPEVSGREALTTMRTIFGCIKSSETGRTVTAKHRPVVIITSNAEKELPDAFLRRCVFHYIEFPEQEQMEAILRVHFGDLEEKLVKQSLAAFYWLRELRGIEKKPSTSELVDWIRALVAGGVDPARIEKEIPFAGVLLKKDKDLQTLRKVK